MTCCARRATSFSDLRFHQEELFAAWRPPWKSRNATEQSRLKSKGAHACQKSTQLMKDAGIAPSGLLFALAMALSFIEGPLVIPAFCPA